MANQLRVLSTNRGGIKIHYNGYTYEKHREHNEKYYWVCELRRNNDYKCNVRLITTRNDDQSHELISKQVKTHNHEPNAFREKVSKIV